MDKQIEELLRLLNKGVAHLPNALNVIVQQYAINRWVRSGFEFLAALILVLATWRIMIAFKGEPRDEDGILSDKEVVYVITGVITTFFLFLMLLLMAKDISSALSPVYSLIQSLR